MVGKKHSSSSSSSNSSSMMLHFLPHHFFLILLLVLPSVSAEYNPANDADYQLTIESRQSDDVIKFKCPKLGGYWVTMSVRYNRPAYYFYVVRDHVVRYKVSCMYAYKNNLMSNILIFDGYHPDENCRMELGGCTFVIKDNVMYKKSSKGGTQIMGDLPYTECKRLNLWLFSVKYSCTEKPHLHPYVGTKV